MSEKNFVLFSSTMSCSLVTDKIETTIRFPVTRQSVLPPTCGSVSDRKETLNIGCDSNRVRENEFQIFFVLTGQWG